MEELKVGDVVTNGKSRNYILGICGEVSFYMNMESIANKHNLIGQMIHKDYWKKAGWKIEGSYDLELDKAMKLLEGAGRIKNGKIVA